MALTKITTPELFDFSDLNTALQLPTGPTSGTGGRPAAPSTGEWRYNTDEKYVEFWDGLVWRQIDTETIPFDFFNVREYTGDSTVSYPSSTSQTISTDFSFDLSITKALDGPLRSWNVCDTLRNDTDNGTGFNIIGGVVMNFNNTNAETSGGSGTIAYATLKDTTNTSAGNQSYNWGNGNNDYGMNDTGVKYLNYYFKGGGFPTAVNSGGVTPTSGSKMLDGVASTSNFATSTNYPTKQTINSDKNFSISKVTGGGAVQTPHSLGVTPDFIILKPTQTEDWQVWHSTIGTGKYMSFTRNEDGAGSGKDNQFTRASSFSTVSSTIIENNWTGSSYDYMCYAWANKTGVSSFGSFAGSGTGTPVTGLGFQPRLLIVKSYSGSSNTDWLVIDAERGANKQLYINTNSNEQTATGWSFDSDGFTPNGGTWDASGTSYIYMAWA
tara:strand:+ start:13196 stop:14512 length:1317 start_codon:yes stop_codon:yes gene_type:complete